MAEATKTASADGPAGVDARLARDRGISYLHLPADDPRQAAAFYAAAFGWNIRDTDTEAPGFDDGTGHVSGKWVRGLAVQRRPGPLLFIYVNDIEAVARAVSFHGGDLVRPPYVEGNLRVAHFRDPAGNVLGLWSAAAVPAAPAHEDSKVN